MVVQICVGSSCHLKGTEKIIELFQSAISKNKLEDEVALAGCFCTGRCNRVGVTVTVDDAVYPGVTAENFNAFFDDKILKQVNNERN